MSDHEHQTFAVGQREQFFCFSLGAGHGFLNKDMFSDCQRRLGHLVMEPQGGGDDNGVEFRVFHQFLELGGRRHVRMQPFHVV